MMNGERKMNGECNGVIDRTGDQESMDDKSPTVVIADSFVGYPAASFVIPRCFEGDIDHVLVPRGMIDDRAESMAKDIHNRLNDRPLVALCVMNGAFRFYNLLMEKLMHLRRVDSRNCPPIYFDFVRLKSYVDDSSCGEPRLLSKPENLAGKHVLVVEDIIETGLTMRKLLGVIQQQHPASVSVASMVIKRTPNRPDSDKGIADYVGFQIPDRFVIGFGFDFNDNFRDLEHICVISERGKQKYAKK